ncbi:MAG: TonB-dependent siderophore receptor [Cyanobacteria bacterium P01_D01_bin.115]
MVTVMMNFWISVRLAVLLAIAGGAVALEATPATADEGTAAQGPALTPPIERAAAISESSGDEATTQPVSTTMPEVATASTTEESPAGVSPTETPAPTDEAATAATVVNVADLTPETLAVPAATTVADWLAQIEASLTQITTVRVEPTEAGLQIVLETAAGELATPTTQTVGNALVADIPNAVLALPEGDAFEQFEPAAGIALVQVTNEPGDQVRVAITGTDAPPVGEVTATGLAVTLGEAVAGAEDDAIQVVVTGEGDEGYNPSSATTATRTDTPLRDIPQSIQVVPEQVIEDRRPRNITQAVETVSGVVDGGNNFGTPSGARIIRGFSQGFAESASGGNYRNGFRDGGYFTLTGIGTVERVEVLKGPASVLYGSAEPGGIINVITRKPLSEPYYSIEFEGGNREFYQPSIDLSGPLSADGNALYRFIASYQNADGFQDFVNTDLTTIAPSFSFNFGDSTELDLYYEYISFTGDPAEQYSGLFSDGSFIPEDFFLGYPQFNLFEQTTQKVGYTLSHNFSDDLQIRNSISVNLTDAVDRRALGNELVDDRFLTDFYTGDFEYTKDNYFGQVDLLGRFNTGSLEHQLLLGFDFNIFDGTQVGTEGGTLPDLDLFNPNYDVLEPVNTSRFDVDEDTESYGVYLQNQIDILDNFKLLIGGRFDWIDQETIFLFDDEDFSSPAQSSNAFSPRVGLVYQPSELTSLYASYSSSFNPTTGFNLDGEAFEPTRGTQYEVGVRMDWLDGRLSTNLAAYHLTKTNVTTADPDNPDFEIQVGEQSSQGVELDITGEILPGWSLIASYAYTDAEITEDNTFDVGNQLVGVPEHQVSLWTTYEIQTGDLSGLGFGLGIFYVGERAGDLDNTFVVPDYLRTDAAIYYRRNQLNVAINIRNLFDMDYFRSSDGGRIFLQRGEPFEIQASVEWTF